ncbi:hypothetical protein KFE25_009436 [Diacronema lutheri]|uniref:FeS cluster biogenesis domain-containing protein n=1 Tax=Diacronema lutheri TaxID=2081491 RepID=A0A8J5XZT8_DIALT|nr:hypothetical protein KFE25_009436 [Diacronema lutheri]
MLSRVARVALAAPRQRQALGLGAQALAAVGRMTRPAAAAALHRRSLAGAARRALPPPLKLTDRCARKLVQLLEHKPDAVAVRIKMVNDWSSSTGFSFQMDFAKSKEPGEEMIVQDGARLYVESQALFNTETGLLGSTLDMDDNLEISIIPPPKRDSRAPR